MKEYIVGLDIGSSKICAAAGTIDKNGSLQIMGVVSVNSEGVKKGIIVDIDSASKAIKDCIVQLERMIDTTITKVFIALSGGISELAFNKGVVAVSSDDREIRGSDIKRVLSAAKIVTIPADKEIIGIIPQQYIVDGYDKIKDPLGMSGLRLEVDAQLILSQSTIVNNIFKGINKSGLKVEGIIFEPIAIEEAVFAAEEKERTVAIIDAGAETIGLSVFKNGNLMWIDNIPYGGNIITNDISICLKVPHSQAEKLKNDSRNITLDASKVKHNIKELELLNEIIEARVEELLIIIKSKLIKSNYYDEISELVIVGGGLSFFKGVEDFAYLTFNRNVKVPKLNIIGSYSMVNTTAVGVVKSAWNALGKDLNVTITKDEEAGFDKEHLKKRNKITSKDSDVTESSGIITKIKDFFTDFF